MTDTIGDLLTEEEAATYLKINPWTLRLWRKENRGPQWTKIGGAVRYPTCWLADYINAQARGPVPQESA